MAVRGRPLILVTNDDGIESPGIAALAKSMKLLGDVMVIAPKVEQSAVAHSISIRGTVSAHTYQLDGGLEDTHTIAVTGTPVDCMKLAFSSLLPRQPDMVVSGINRGANTAVNVIYSGTVGAAMESSLQGVVSLAFSLLEGAGDDYSAAAQYAYIIVSKMLRSRLPRGIVLNVNIPAIPFGDIQGVKVTRLARAHWEENFLQVSSNAGEQRYTYRGELIDRDKGSDTDLYALEHGFVSVTPIKYDPTAHGCIDVLGTWRWRKRSPF